MQVTPRPLAIAHRGLPGEQPENTLAAFRAALDAGADGLETDLVLTKDERILLWHDPEPTGFGPLVRRLGLEPGTKYRPSWPAHARPVHTMAYAEARAGLGYRGSAEPVPVVEQLLDLTARDPRCRQLMLEIKLPEGRPDLALRMAARLKPMIDARGLAGKVVMFGFDGDALEAMQRAMGPGYRFAATLTSPAFTFKRPDPTKFSAVDAAVKHGFAVASVGRQRLLDWFGWKRDSFLAGLKRDQARRPDLPIAVWTLNEPADMRAARDAGADLIITDDVRALRRVLDQPEKR